MKTQDNNEHYSMDKIDVYIAGLADKAQFKMGGHDWDTDLATVPEGELAREGESGTLKEAVVRDFLNAMVCLFETGDSLSEGLGEDMMGFAMKEEEAQVFARKAYLLFFYINLCGLGSRQIYDTVKFSKKLDLGSSPKAVENAGFLAMVTTKKIHIINRAMHSAGYDIRKETIENEWLMQGILEVTGARIDELPQPMGLENDREDSDKEGFSFVGKSGVLGRDIEFNLN